MRIPSNRVSDIRRYCHAELDGLYGAPEVESMSRMLFEAFLGWDTITLLLNNGSTINQSDLLRFHWAVEDLKRFRPIQHVIGYTEFCGCRIEVSPDVLIPRPETAQLVEFALSRFASCCDALSSPKVLDLCTGSGCIAIALAKAMPKADVCGCDISDKALDIARRNAVQNHVSVHFDNVDVSDSKGLLSYYYGKRFDLILSNPPYVMEKERAEMHRNVLDYDPALALFVSDDNPLLFYRVIGLFAANNLSPKGLLMLEVNEHLAADTVALMRDFGFGGEVIVDFRGKERFVICHRL